MDNITKATLENLYIDCRMNFNYDNIYLVMDALSWVYAQNPQRTPTQLEMIQVTDYLFQRCIEEIERRDLPAAVVGTGGFEVFVDSKNELVSIKFIAAEWESYTDGDPNVISV